MADRDDTPNAADDLDAFLGRKRRSPLRRRARWIVLGLVALLVLFGLSRCFRGEEAVAYATEPARRGDLAVTVSATGNITPTNTVEVGSEVSGLVTQVAADVNDRVRAGQALALIDPAQLDDAITRSSAQLSANEAAVAQAEATLAETRAALERLEEVSRLSGGRVPAQTELDTARAAVQRARAGVRAAGANVTSARAQLSSDRTQRARAIIRSPVSGVVLARRVEPGQTVAAAFNTPTLFVIAEDLTSMELKVSIDEADVGQVQAGQRATFTVDAYPGRSFPATITRVNVGSNSSATVAGTGTTATAGAGATTVVAYEALLSVANRDQLLRPGMTATADIAVQARDDVMLVPNAALRFTPQPAGAAPRSGVMIGPSRPDGPAPQTRIGAGSRQTVHVVGDDGRPRPISVVTGASDGRSTEVTGRDLRPGMQVIVGRRAAGPNG